MNELVNEADETEVESEAVLSDDIKTLDSFIKKIHAPEVIRSFVLEQMDRLPPSTQFVCKCAALVGTYFSRQILYSLVRGHGQDKINKAFRELIEANIIEPITASVNHKVDFRQGFY
jgi:predicted ATPase